MTKHKKKSNKIILISIIMCVIIIGLIATAFILQKTQTNYFYDKELGWITTKITTNNVFFNWIISLFTGVQQAVTFTPGNYYIGDKITFTESSPVGNIGTSKVSGTYCGVDIINIKIQRDSNTPVQNVITLDSPIKAFQTEIHNSYITPTNAGLYSAVTDYQIHCCNSLSNICQSNSACQCSTKSSEYSTNKVTVQTKTVTPCTSVNTHSSWSDYDTNIEGGKIQTRTHTVSNNNPPVCSNSVTNEYQTICNNGYHIDGQDGLKLAPVQTYCEVDETTQLNPNPDPNPSPTDTPTPDNPNPDNCGAGTYFNVISGICESCNCNGDVIDSNCGVVTATCVNNCQLQPTGSTCDNPIPNPSPNPSVSPTTKPSLKPNQSNCLIAITAPPCTNAKSLVDNNGCFTGWDNSSCSSTIDWGFWSIIIIASIIIIIFIIVLYKRYH